MEKIIKKAIDGGWKPFGSLKLDGNEWEVGDVYANFYHQPIWFLDPLFWQSLGKACEWESIGGFNEWFVKGRMFHEKNLEKGFESAVEWLESIIN